MAPAKNHSLAKFWPNFAGLRVSFSQKAVSESQIFKTKEIGESASRAHQKMPCLGVSQSLNLTILYPWHLCWRLSGLLISGENRKIFHEQECEKTLISLLTTDVSTTKVHLFPYNINNYCIPVVKSIWGIILTILHHYISTLTWTEGLGQELVQYLVAELPISMTL